MCDCLIGKRAICRFRFDRPNTTNENRRSAKRDDFYDTFFFPSNESIFVSVHILNSSFSHRRLIDRWLLTFAHTKSLKFCVSIFSLFRHTPKFGTRGLIISWEKQWTPVLSARLRDNFRTKWCMRMKSEKRPSYVTLLTGLLCISLHTHIRKSCSVCVCMASSTFIFYFCALVCCRDSRQSY